MSPDADVCRAILLRFLRALDGTPEPTLDELIDVDAVLMHKGSELRGREAVLAALAARRREPGEPRAGVHVLANDEASETEPDRLRIRATVVVLKPDADGRPRPDDVLDTEQEFVRSGGSWRLVARTTRPILGS